MWKNINGNLIHTTDPSRVKFKTYISKSQLDYLYNLADDKDTHVSYLLENGLYHLMQDNSFSFNKNSRLKDKVEFRTTGNKDVLNSAKEFARQHKLNFTDIIQCSVNYINASEVKNKNWRHRIE